MNQKKHTVSPKVSKKMLTHVAFSGLLEFGPVILFLISSHYVKIYGSTIILMIATIISTVVTFRFQKRIPYVALYVAAITLVFGYMTLHFRNVKFIQMRDTLYDTTSALTLIIGIMINVQFLKLAFGEVISMTTRAWNRLTYLWIGFFILLAISNEVTRRLFSLTEWFHFKGWMVVATSIFGLLSIYISYEEKEEK
jgi:intracellular septation protein